MDQSKWHDPHDPNNVTEYEEMRRDRSVTPELLMFFGRMEAKLDGALQWMQKHEIEATKIKDDIEDLKQKHATAVGIAVGVSFVISTIAGVISYTLATGGGL